jgi:RNA polymerase sigma factor (sigma-70 family)
MPDGQLQEVVHYLRRVTAPGGPGSVSDAELLERFARWRDEAAFELLVWRHGKMVLGTCRRLLRHEQDAEDAFQAVFLVLARRAGALGRRQSVGGWLYRVAYHLALRARAAGSRRREREQTPLRRADHVVDPVEEAAQRELRQTIDEEVNRLPEKYRLPFILCHLGGRSNAEAARELGCPVGTLESWLARARQRLRGGLTRRGVVLPAGLFASALAALAGPADMSAALIGPTARAALLVATGPATVGILSAQATAWMEGVLRTMYVTKLKIVTAVLLTVGMAGAGVGGLVYGSRAAEEPSRADRSDIERIDRLIEQLGSESFQERESAVKELDKIGAPALKALRDAAKSEDPEVKRRAASLVVKIERRQASADILRAKRVHLVYKNTPVSDAVADFRKKSGYNVALLDPEGKLKKRKITLDTGDTTFWHAFELFREKAGLVEATMEDVLQQAVPPGVPDAAPGAPGGAGGGAVPIQDPVPSKPAEGDPAQPDQDQALAADQDPTTVAPPAPKPADAPKPPQATPPAIALPAQAPPGIAIGGGFPGMPFVPGQTEQLLLKDGKFKKRPTDDTSAIRIRALADAKMFGTAAEGELLLALEATPEPRLQWLGVDKIKITKVLDDRGQSLKQVQPKAPENPANGLPGGVIGGAPGAGAPAIAIASVGYSPNQIPVHLKKGAKAAKTLKELSGVITAQVLVSAKPMITVAKLAKAAGKTFKGAKGGFIKIISVKTDKDKKTTIKFEFEPPPSADGGNFGFGIAQPGVVVPAQPALPAVPPPAPPAQPAPGGAPAANAAGVAQAVEVQAVPGAIGGFGGGAPMVMTTFNGITIQDDKGKTLPVQLGQQLVQVEQQPGGVAKVIFTYSLVCEPGKGRGQPVKMVYQGRQRTTIDIPFTLKKVPLP